MRRDAVCRTARSAVARRKDVAGPRLEKLDKEKVTRVKQDGARQVAVPAEPKVPNLPDIAAPTRTGRPGQR